MEDLKNLRKIIDVLDDEILALIAERQEIVERIGKLKSKQNLAVLDQNREEYLKQYHLELSTKHDLSSEFVINLFEIIMAESRKVQSHDSN